jgi:hypothetical protein
MKPLFAFLITLLVLSGCSQIQPSAAPTPTATATPIIPLRSDLDENHYAAEQLELINTNTFQSLEGNLTQWAVYWQKADNSPFAPGTTLFSFMYYFDYSNLKSAGLCLKADPEANICYAIPKNALPDALSSTPASGSYTISAQNEPDSLLIDLSDDNLSAAKIDSFLVGSILGW